MIDTLAVAALCGLPVERMVSADPVEQVFWNRVTKRAGELNLEVVRYQANQNAVQISRLFKR